MSEPENENEPGPECPTDDELASYVEGALPAPQRRAIWRHAQRCERCHTLVVASVKLAEDVTPSLGVTIPEQRAGRYVLRGALGMGAMGIVYDAFDPELGRKLAIKILRPTGDARTEERRQRFVREGRSLARVVHPNVVAIYDVGQLGDQIFIAMELIEGGTLRDWLLRGGHGPSQILQLFEEIGRGLNAVHKAGLVHRDFKPENVLIDREGRPRVTDFGLARAELGDATPSFGTPLPNAAKSTDPRALTETGALLGTPAYMAPEQLRGAVPDARADVFAFCVVLWEALFGTRPFAGSSLAELDESISAQRVLRPPLPRPAPRVLQEVVPILQRGLRANPAERTATLDELLAQLRRLQRPPRRPLRWVAGAVVGMVLFSAVPGGLMWRARERARCEKHTTLVGWAALRDRLRTKLLAAPLPGPRSVGEHIVKMLDHYAIEVSEQRRAVCEATYVRRAQSERAFDAQMECLQRRQQRLELLTESLLAEPKLSPSASDSVSNLPPASVCSEETGQGKRPSGSQAQIDEAARLLAVAQTQLNLAHTRVAERYYQRARAASEALGDRAMQAESTLGLGQAALILGRLGEARVLIEEGIAGALAAHDGYLAHCGYELVMQHVWRARGKIEDAERALQLFRWLSRRNPRGKEIEARLLAELAGIYSMYNRHDDARRALDEGLNVPDVTAVQRAYLEHGLGDAYLDLNRLAEAEKMLDASLEHAIAATGPDSSTVLSIESSRVFLAYAQGGAAAALPLAQRLVERLDRFGNDVPLQLVDALQNLAAYLAQVNRDEESLQAAGRAVAIAQQGLPPDDSTRLAAEASYGSALVDAGRDDEARELLDRLLPIVEPLSSKNDHSPSGHALDVRFALARLDAKRNPAAARAHLARARQIAALFGARADVKAIVTEMDQLGARLNQRHPK